MPYLAFDLDAKKRVPKVARAAGVSAAEIGWGLLELWEHVWESKRAEVGEVALHACFGPNAEIVAALDEFGFIERTETGWRVRGADRYLRVSEARSKGAKATNAKRWGATNERPEESPPSRSSVAPESLKRPKQVALTPNTEHRSPNRESTPTREAESPPLGEQLDAAFQRVRGVAYQRTARDLDALRELLRLANGDEAEIARRYALGLERKRFPLITTWVDLSRNWMACATAEPQAGPRPADKRAPTAANDFTNAKTGTEDWT